MASGLIRRPLESTCDGNSRVIVVSEIEGVVACMAAMGDLVCLSAAVQAGGLPA